jgi:hypothetical protein
MDNRLIIGGIVILIGGFYLLSSTQQDVQNHTQTTQTKEIKEDTYQNYTQDNTEDDTKPKHIEPKPIINTQVQKTTDTDNISNTPLIQQPIEENTKTIQTQKTLVDTKDKTNKYQILITTSKEFEITPKKDSFFDCTIDDKFRLSFKLNHAILDNLDNITFVVKDISNNKTIQLNQYSLNNIEPMLLYSMNIDTNSESFFIDYKNDLTKILTLKKEDIQKLLRNNPIETIE